MAENDRAFLEQLFHVAVQAADPQHALKPHMPERPKGRLVIVGAGKGAAQMAAAFEELWPDPVTGVVVTRYGYGAKTRHIEVLEAAHPVPDKAGLAATKALFDTVENLTADDLVVALICGGGSALLPAPVDGVTFEDEVALNEVLLASGAPISVMNAIRKQVSRIKGGGLAKAAAPARVLSLIVSDVPGDSPAEVASGPTVASDTTRAQALGFVERYNIQVPEAVRKILNTPTDEPAVENTGDARIIASAAKSLEAAAEVAKREGIETVILSSAIEGEARDVGLVHAAIAREIAERNRPFQKPCLLLSGGETSVTLGKLGGRGGRNTEFLLSFASGIEGLNITALAADTDGIDGSEDNAGAFADGSSCDRLRAIGADPGQLLASHDAWGAFDTLGDLFITGPTGTNVNDFRAILIR